MFTVYNLDIDEIVCPSLDGQCLADSECTEMFECGLFLNDIFISVPSHTVKLFLF